MLAPGWCQFWCQLDHRQPSKTVRLNRRSVVLGIPVGLAFVAVVGAVLFGCAGRWDLPWFWAYLGAWVASAVIGPIVVDPTLIKERVRPGPGGRDYLTAVVFVPLWLGQHAVGGLDVGRRLGRAGWSKDAPRCASHHRRPV